MIKTFPFMRWNDAPVVIDGEEFEEYTCRLCPACNTWIICVGPKRVRTTNADMTHWEKNHAETRE